MLLWTQDGTWPGYSDPSNKIRCIEVIMLHCIGCYQGACPTKSSFAVNSNCSFFIFDNVQELVNNGHTGSCSISEKQFVVFDAVLSEAFSLIGFIVEPDYGRHSQFLENGHIVLWTVQFILG